MLTLTIACNPFIKHYLETFSSPTNIGFGPLDVHEPDIIF